MNTSDLQQRFQHIQQLLGSLNIDAWMMYDFRGSNPIAQKVCGVDPQAHCTRKWAVIVPREGTVVKIVSAIEAHTLEHVPADETRYADLGQWRAAVTAALAGHANVAMEYSPFGALPVVSKVDAGTVEWVRSLGVTVVSSADMAQHLQAVWTSQQREENLQTSRLVREAMMDAMGFLSEKIRLKQHVTEYDVQQHIIRFFDHHHLVTDHDPIVAIAPNAANPHYAPELTNKSVITADTLVLIDMWAKGDKAWSTYADITWMCYTGAVVPERYVTLFSVIRDARNAALQLVRTRFSEGREVRGYEVDDAARSVIATAGYGEWFIHRTGHNIGEETHGAGANMDDYETHDERVILKGTSFSIEPGIYIPGDVGLRTEISVVIDDRGNVLVPSDPIQNDIICLAS